MFSDNKFWHPGFSLQAFNSVNTDQKLALGNSTMPLFSSSTYYWIQSSYANKYKTILIYVSLETRKWIADDDKLICPIALGLDYWVVDNKLVSKNIRSSVIVIFHPSA